MIKVKGLGEHTNRLAVAGLFCFKLSNITFVEGSIDRLMQKGKPDKPQTKKQKVPLPTVRPLDDTKVEVQRVAGYRVEERLGTMMQYDTVGMQMTPGMRLISQAGVVHKFSTPMDLMMVAAEYFDRCLQNPIVKQEMIKGGPAAGMAGSIELPRVFTLLGLRLHLGLSQGEWEKYKSGVGFEKFHSVVTKLEEICHLQMFEHAAVGLYNPNLASKVMGLVEKKEVKQDVTKKVYHRMVVMDSGPKEDKEE